MSNINTSVFDDGVLFLDNLHEVTNLSEIRQNYNSIVYCRAGRILLEMPGNRQIKIKPGQMLLIPTGKVIQPMLVSTDIDANALLISDQMQKLLLNNQMTIWNKAMYMQELYVIEETEWVNDMGKYIKSMFKHFDHPLLAQEITYSFLRTMLLMICEKLIHQGAMLSKEDNSTAHDKHLFNRFLQLMREEPQKRLQVAEYASKMNITPKYLSTVCKKVSGKSPMRWITDSVMEDCYKMLLESELSIKEIANQLGFPNASFFGQYFREQAGMTPMSYRTKYKRMA